MGRGLLYQYDLTDTRRTDLTAEDATKIRVDATDGLRLYGTTAGKRKLTFPTSGGPWRMDLPTWTIGAFESLVAVDAEESTVGFETNAWTGAAADAPGDLTIEYQVNVGGTRYWWDSASWTAVATNADANDLDDLQANIADTGLRDLLRAAGGELGISVVLATTSKHWSPTVRNVRLLVDVGQPDTVEDAVAQALAPDLQGIAIPAHFGVVAPAGGLSGTINLLTNDDVRQRIPWDFVALTAAYDLTNDPQRGTDLLSGSTVGALTQVAGRTYRAATATLSSPVAAGDTLRLEFTFRAPATVATALDFATGVYEIGPVPEIQVRDVEIIGNTEDLDTSIVSARTNPGDGVDDGYTLTGQRSLDIEITLSPRSEYDGLDTLIAQAIRQHLGRGAVVTSPAFGTSIAVELIEPGAPVIDERGRLHHYDLRVRVYSLREPGAYSAAKLTRTHQIDGASGPPR